MSNRHNDHGQYIEGPDVYRFSFDATGTRVTKMTEIDDGRSKNLSLRGWSFEFESDATGGVTSVSRNQMQRGVLKTARYEDTDGDGAFEEAFSSEVLALNSAAIRADKARFTFDSQGDVLTMQELSRGRWKAERLDANERLEVIALGGADYVVKVNADGGGTEWNLYRDDNRDGVWTEVAKIESSYTDNLVELVGVTDVLASANGLVG